MLGEPHTDIFEHNQSAGHASYCDCLPTMLLLHIFSLSSTSPTSIFACESCQMGVCLHPVINLDFISLWLAKMRCYKGTLCKVSSSGCCIYLVSFGWRHSTVTGEWGAGCRTVVLMLWRSPQRDPGDVFCSPGHWPGWSKKTPTTPCKVETFVISKVILTPWIIERKCRPARYGCLVGLLFHLPLCLITTWLDSTE